MLDQLKIGSGTSYKLSYEDFDASLAERAVKAPEKKEIKETVPFSNQTYDFSKINGDLYWKERELVCVFEIIADSPEELEEKKTAFSNWIMNVFNEEIHDPFDPEYHYVGTYYDMEYDDEDCMEKTTATVTFKVFPYKVANSETNYVFNVNAKIPYYLTVRNDSGHGIIPTVTTDVEISIVNNGKTHEFPVGETIHRPFMLAIGDNMLKVTNLRGEDPHVPKLIPNGEFVTGIDLFLILNGSTTLYRTCTPQSDGTFTLSEPYDADFWNSLDSATRAQLLVGCWLVSFEKPVKITSASGTYLSGESYGIVSFIGSATVKISFYREVF